MKIIKLLGAIICGYIYSVGIAYQVFLTFIFIVHFFAFVLPNHFLLGLGDFLGIIVFLALWGITMLFGKWHTKLTNDYSKTTKIILSTVMLLIGVMTNISLLFITPYELTVAEIGLGFWYYFGATMSLIVAIILYITLIIHTLNRE